MGVCNSQTKQKPGAKRPPQPDNTNVNKQTPPPTLIEQPGPAAPVQVLAEVEPEQQVLEVIEPKEQVLSDLPVFIRTGNAAAVWETIEKFAAKGVQADIVRGTDEDFEGTEPATPMTHFSLVEIALAFSQTEIAVNLVVKGRHPLLNRVFMKISDSTKEAEGVIDAECYPLKIAVQNKDWHSLCSIWKAAKNAWTSEHFQAVVQLMMDRGEEMQNIQGFFDTVTAEKGW